MIDFTNIEYLGSGNSIQKKAYNLIIKHKIFKTLDEFKPILVGTIPININIKGSDLDIICHFSSKESFWKTLDENFSYYPNFKLRDSVKQEKISIICSFNFDDFPIEIFGQEIPTCEQNAFKHMIVEHLILKEKGETFRQQIIELKKQGLKTEPAFAQLLNLNGDAYNAMLEYFKGMKH